MIHHGLVRFFGDGLDVVRIVHGHLRIVLVLNQWVRESVADSNTFKINSQPFFILVSFIDSGRNCWGIMTAVAFAEYEEFTLLVFGMPHEKCLQKNYTCLLLLHLHCDHYRPTWLHMKIQPEQVDQPT